MEGSNNELVLINRQKITADNAAVISLA